MTMKLIRSFALCAFVASSIGAFGCSSEGSDADAITDEDIVDLGDLVTADSDKAAAAEQIGDPATLLAEAKREAEVARGDVAAVFDFLRQAAEGEPTKRGKTPRGAAYAQWVKTIEGVEVRATLIRVTAGRLRYLLQGKKADGTHVPLLTGIFLKRASKAGGGRFHVNLTNVSDLFTVPEADGSLHFWFANGAADKRGRRIHYKNVTRRDDPSAPPVSFGADLVRIVGQGGRFRSVGVTDAVPNVAGDELFALRVRWKAGEGGRGDALLVNVADPKAPVVLGDAHECWDKDGLRTAYLDSYADNDAEDPNEGDTASCSGLDSESVPESEATMDGVDADPELDALLDESGASEISEVEADLVEEAP
jgi:hypothetical protein